MNPGYSFNVKYVKSINKTKFIKEFENIYPHLDLPGIYDQIVGRKKKDSLKEG